MQVFEVGKPYEPLIGRGEEAHMQIDGSGMLLLLNFPGCTHNEYLTVKSGTLDIRYCLIDNEIFFVYRFGDLPWMDVPYTPHLSPEINKLLRPESPNGYNLTTVLCDSPSATVKVIRSIGLATDFSQRLYDAIQYVLGNEFSPEEYDKKLKRVFSRYTSKGLLEKCQVVCRVRLRN